MDKLGNSILPIEVIDDRTIQPYELLQVNIDNIEDTHQNYMQSHHSVFHPESPETTMLGSCHKIMRAGFPDIESDRWRFFGHHHHEQIIKQEPPSSAPVESHQQRRAKRCMQQRLRRVNETNEEKEARRQKNRELNRRRRANLDDVSIAAEKSRNRLRQRVKREITRMIRTGEQREDFIKETFLDVDNYFSKDEYNSLYSRVRETVEFIQNRQK